MPDIHPPPLHPSLHMPLHLLLTPDVPIWSPPLPPRPTIVDHRFMGNYGGGELCVSKNPPAIHGIAVLKAKEPDLLALKGVL